jgi:hypothetical protein
MDSILENCLSGVALVELRGWNFLICIGMAAVERACGGFTF